MIRRSNECCTCFKKRLGYCPIAYLYCDFGANEPTNNPYNKRATAGISVKRVEVI
jgi:hypothetical protein